MKSHKTANIKAVFIDLDGTIYLGDTLIPGAKEFLLILERNQIKYFFLSNNSSRSKIDYVNKLMKFGIETHPDTIILSTDGLIRWLHTQGITKAYIVGTKAMVSMMEQSGIYQDADDPDYVVLGYDTEITYHKLTVACHHLQRGVPLLATHPDIVCPSRHSNLPDVGAYLSLFERATNVTPSRIFGKPNPETIQYKLEELSLFPENVAMIGDRLYTDMELARRIGCKSILVLSGETNHDLYYKNNIPVDLIIDSVADLCKTTNPLK